jgi:predicted house-cleaning noncanonical NTP pyrophosphatase (MazG superfamily)
MSQQTSNRLKQPPEFLAVALKQLRALPPGFELRSLEEVRAQVWNWWRIKREPKSFDSAPAEVREAKDAAEIVFETLPEEFQEYLRSATTHGLAAVLDLIEILRSYENFRWLRETLRRIARIGFEAPQIGPDDAPRYRIEETIPVAGTMSLDTQGLLDVNLHPFYKGLDGIEATRIRECQNPKCKHLFWAGRLDKAGCSDRCLQALRDRRWRENYLQNYKPQRLGLVPKTSGKAKKKARARNGSHAKKGK